RMNKKYLARRAQRRASQPPRRASQPPPRKTSGTGWRVVNLPIVPHERLEELARGLWDLITLGRDWPSEWVVRWATLTEGVVGLCVYESRTICIDEKFHHSAPAMAVGRHRCPRMDSLDPPARSPGWRHAWSAFRRYAGTRPPLSRLLEGIT